MQLLAGCLLVQFILTGCTQPAKIDLSDLFEVGRHAAVSPDHRYEWWGARHQKILDRVQQGNVDLIFIGDSITHGWENDGADIWEEHYAPCNAVNMGFGGDQTQHVLWRLDHGEIDGIAPRVAVLLIGINNIHGNSPQEIADGVEAVCLTLQAKLPRTRILLLAIFPYQEHPGPIRDKVSEANRIISQLNDGRWIYYLDIGDKFLRPDKTMPAEIMPDFLHPNVAGYKIWAEAMEPKLAELMELGGAK
jgi:lysophospholipase L1-like esterase